MNTFKDIIIKKEHINQIPVLMISSKEEIKKPVIFLFHKILEDKTQELPIALKLAENGFFVCIIDMCGHGERENSYYKKSAYNFNGLFKDIYGTATDVREVMDFLHHDKSKELDFDNVGVIGVSIGGSVALTASYLIAEVKFAASVIGTCNWHYLVENDMFRSFRFFSETPEVLDSKKVQADIEKYEHCNNITSSNSVPILFQHGLCDMGIPIKCVNEYYEKISEIYTQYGKEESLKLIKYKKAGHKITSEMAIDLVNWVKEQIKK